jgi:membrane fusion protein (multidrug efflux system)
VEIDSAGLTREGEVIFVSDRIQPGSQTFEVRVKLDNADGAIKAGAFARVKMVRRDEPQALLIPLRAVLRDEGETNVFVARDGKAAKVPVRLGETQADRVLVLDGLKAGDELITSGVAELEPGQAVQL